MNRILCQDTVAEQLREVRERTVELCRPLAIEDYGVQPMDDASPPKWHLAHTTWFFETFVLRPELSTYSVFADTYEYLFNSYYNGIGDKHPRPKRGLLSRPLVQEIYDYRKHVDQSLNELLQVECSQDILSRIELGIHHEQQHQELILTDLKYNLGHNPLLPAYQAKEPSTSSAAPPRKQVLTFNEGKCQIGTNPDSGFCFDNESPQHAIWLNSFCIESNLASNGEYLEFIQDGGYSNPALWLSDGWVECQTRGWRAPEYWVQKEGEWFEYTLYGLAPVNPQYPVCHVSFYEADAYARWANRRLPTEFEWEHATTANEGQIENPVLKNTVFADSNYFHPTQSRAVLGSCWQWTSSSYSPYPGYRPLPGTLGEYNGKFMSNQYVLRGGSCATPRSHWRPSYRNFFYSKDRWQFTGIRLADDIVA